MNNVEPPTNVRDPGRPADDLDGLLRAYFQAEMPHPWPALAPPDRAVPFRPQSDTAAHLNGYVGGAPARRPKAWATARSRLALAATLLLLLGGTLLLSGKFHLNSADANLGQLSAKRNIHKIIDPSIDADSAIDPDNVQMRESIVQPGNLPTEYRIDMTFREP